MACSPVASMAVMLRSRKMTTGGRPAMSCSRSSSLSVAPKQEGSVNAVDGDIVRNVVQLQAVATAVLDVLACHPRDGRRRGDPPDVQQCRENHPGLDGHRQIGEHGEQESDAPYRGLRRTELEDVGNLAPFAHVVGDD